LDLWYNWVKKYCFPQSDILPFWQELKTRDELFKTEYGDYKDHEFKKCLEDIRNNLRTNKTRFFFFCDTILENWDKNIQDNPDAQNMQVEEKGILSSFLSSFLLSFLPSFLN
jgi:hypothetical protein